MPETLDTLNGVDVSTERSEEFHFRFVIGSGQSKRTLHARNIDEARQACGIDVEKQRREGMANRGPSARQVNWLHRNGVPDEHVKELASNFTQLQVYDLIAGIIERQQAIAQGVVEGYLNPTEDDSDEELCHAVTKSGGLCRNVAGKCQFHS